MSITIYYFSGTGNSYMAARAIWGRLDGRFVSIPSVMDMDKIRVDSDSIAIVFPAYLAAISGVPSIVERFVKKLDDIKPLRIIAVCTCGGYESVNALPALMRLRSIVRTCGGKLSAEYSVRLPMNNLDYDHIPIPICRECGKIIVRSVFKIDDIAARIEKGKGTKFRLIKALFFYLMAPLYALMRAAILRDLREKAKEPVDSKLTYRDLMPLTDKSISVGDNCVGCGICERVCPAANIRMADHRPEFQHRCEMCFACDEWCPQGAIRHWGRAKGVKYHHPYVKTPTYYR